MPLSLLSGQRHFVLFLVFLPGSYRIIPSIWNRTILQYEPYKIPTETLQNRYKYRKFRYYAR